MNESNPSLINKSYNKIADIEREYGSKPSYKTGGGGSSAIEGLSKMMGGSIPNPYQFARMSSSGQASGEAPYKEKLMEQEYGLKGEMMGAEYGLKDVSMGKEYKLKGDLMGKEYGLKDQEYRMHNSPQQMQYRLKQGIDKKNAYQNALTSGRTGGFHGSWGSFKI